MIYKARHGSPMNDEQAQRYGKRLNELSEKYGKITTEIVVADAKDKKSPLHDYFEWDRGVAFEKYLKHQARMLIGAIVIIPEEQPDNTPVRAYYLIQESVEEKQFVHIDKVMSDADYRKEVVAKALKEVNNWKDRYRSYKELKPIFKVIESMNDN